MGEDEIMGLDISHDAWHGAYSAFDRWRTTLAEIVGIPLNLMEGHHGYIKTLTDAINVIDVKPMDTVYRDIILDYAKLIPISWDILKPDVLHVLIHHSDCDGIIEVEHLESLAKRLEELLPLLPEGNGGGHIGDWREKTQKFIDGCRLAASLNEPLEFE
jgi:hypothetical protein